MFFPQFFWLHLWIWFLLLFLWASLVAQRTSLVAQTVKRLPTMLETWVQSLGREDLLEKEMAIHYSILAWKIPWMEEPDRLQSMGSQRVGHDWATGGSDGKESGNETVQSMGWEDPLEKGMGTHSSILAFRIPWTEKPGLLQSIGSQGVGHNWGTELNWTES